MSRRGFTTLLSCAAFALVVPGCGDDKPSRPGGNVTPLTFTREDASTIQFPSSARPYVWCDAWDGEDVPTPALHVQFVDPDASNGAGWMLRAVHGDFSPGDTLRFPNDFVWDQPDSVEIFLFDPPNELSTAQEDARGTIVFQRVPCDGGGDVEFEIDAILGSEIGGMPTVAVQGRFRSPITGRPPWAGR